MKNHIPHILSKFFSSKTLLLAVLISLLSITFVPFVYAASPIDIIQCAANPVLCALSKLPLGSGIGNAIVNAFINGVGAVLDGAVGTIAVVVKAMAETVAGMMQGAVKFFIEIPTSPSNEKTPQAIEDGWIFSRNLVNIVFILILVFIGLATILRLQSYQLQKTLLSLIIVALLINFSGVFVGFVVDIGNIIATVFINMGDSVQTWSLADIPLIPFGGGAAQLGTHIVEIIYYFVSTLVYFVVVLLFAVRTFVLWMLVILAPIAFAAYILPGTKKYWTQWLGQLIQWSILGIPISFMLMLAKKVMLAGPSGFGGLVDANSALYNFMAPFTALLLLFFGITLSMQLAPAGAQGVINMGKKAGIGAGKFAGNQTLGRFLSTKTGEKGAGALAGAKIPGTLTGQELGERWKRAGVLGKAGLALRAATLQPALIGAQWGVRAAGKRALEYGASQPQNIDKRVGEFEKTYGKDYEKAAASYGTLGTTDYQGKIALARYLTKTKGTKGLSQLSDDQRREVLQHTARYDRKRFEDIAKYARDLLSDSKVGGVMESGLISDGAQKGLDGRYKDGDVQAVANALGTDKIAQMAQSAGLTEEQVLIREAAYKKLVDELKDSDLANENPSLMEDQQFRKAVAQWKPWNFIRKMAEEWGLDIVDKLQDEAEDIGLNAVAKTNPSLLRAAYSPQGQMFMRRWRNPATGTQITGKLGIEALIAGTKVVPTIPPPAALTPQENTMIASTAKDLQNTTPAFTKPLAEVEQDLRNEYERKYRPKIYRQLYREQGFIMREADRNFGGDHNAAERARIQDLYDTARWQEQVPIPKKLTKREDAEVEKIALSGTLPPAGDPKRERKLQGAFHKARSLLEDAERNINRLTEIIVKKEALGQNATYERGQRTTYEAELDSYRNRVGKIRGELGP